MAAKPEPPAASPERKWIKTCNPRDLKFDGCPEELTFTNRQNLRIQMYRWTPMRHGIFQRHVTKGTFLICHGINSHLRLSWLHKCSDLERAREVMGTKIHFKDFLKNDSRGLAKFTLDEQVEQFHPLARMNRSFQKWENYSRSLELPADAELSVSGTPANSLDHERARSTTLKALNSVYRNYLAEYKQVVDLYSHGLNAATSDQRLSEVFYDGSWVQNLVEHGYCVVGYDLQGHGRSEAYNGKRGTFRVYNDLVEEFHNVMQIVCETCWTDQKDPRFKLNVAGLSLTTLIIACYLLQKRAAEAHINAVFFFGSLLNRHEIFYNRFAENSLRIAIKLKQFIPQKSFRPQKYSATNLLNAKRAVYGQKDPYSLKQPILLQTIIKCAEAVLFIESSNFTSTHFNCKHMFLLHSYDDRINPVECSAMFASRLFQVRDSGIPLGHSLNAVIFNVPSNPDPVKNHCIDQWHPEVKKIESSYSLDHTLISDVDELYPYCYFFGWLREIE